MTIARGALALAVALAAAGCGDVCEDAAQLCADERQVAAPPDEERDREGEACEGAIEEHAACLVEADTCHPDAVARCWARATGETGSGG